MFSCRISYQFRKWKLKLSLEYLILLFGEKQMQLRIFNLNCLYIFIKQSKSFLSVYMCGEQLHFAAIELQFFPSMKA